MENLGCSGKAGEWIATSPAKIPLPSYLEHRRTIEVVAAPQISSPLPSSKSMTDWVDVPIVPAQLEDGSSFGLRAKEGISEVCPLVSSDACRMSSREGV